MSFDDLGGVSQDPRKGNMYSRPATFRRSIWLGKFDWHKRMAMYSAY